MSTKAKHLQTRKGKITFPAYVPVTTFGDKYPLDKLIRPYLPRLASAAMVSYHYAKQMAEGEELSIPLMIDSGGFASLFSNAKVKMKNGLGVIEFQEEDDISVTTPYDVLELQEELADIAFTLDFPIPPGTAKKEATKRIDLTIANAHWAIDNCRRRDLPLYACIQAWNRESAKECAQTYAQSKFDGIAIGGLVPRARDKKLILEIVDTVREEIPDLPLHVFGLGSPNLYKILIRRGVDSVDSSSYVKYAADGNLWGNSKTIKDPTSTDRLHLALCNLARATSISSPLASYNMLFRTSFVKNDTQKYLN